MILHGPRLKNQFFPLAISILLSFKSILSNEFFMALTKVCLNAYFKMANTVRPKWNLILCSKWDTFKSARKVIKILSPLVPWASNEMRSEASGKLQYVHVAQMVERLIKVSAHLFCKIEGYTQTLTVRPRFCSPLR